ncbi:MAG TPA: bifunctional UDP-N-acetylglucosamine diphosphorylase/glucosamine-1-phosphate N-acetyltransferase GlmU [Acetobacteraceae bacterium]|nr:bifunctional UDP-N-acetylglucosamine diphosphorylase/glucosamine-1-phosphate N-acetyltransferase GlmU [Acetobacteraceae bacterium]
MTTTAVILAAGHGTRMKSAAPKALHRIAGWPMLRHLITSCEQVFDRIAVVIGPGMEAVAEAAAPHRCFVQKERLGTAHAAQQAAPAFADGDVAVLYADNPLIRPATLRRLLERRAEGDAALVLLAMRPENPARYGRVLTDQGYVNAIVEYADAGDAERAVDLCNAGVFCAAAADLRRWLHSVRNDNASREFYLTDVVAHARAEGERVAWVEASPAEVAGINSRAELAAAEATMQGWLRAAAMDAGVTMTDPASVFLSADTELAADVTIGPNVVFGPGVRVGRGTQINPFSHLEGCTIGEDCIIGPFARLRPGAELESQVHIGNFVELKATRMGRGAKANHLAYLGDSEVGGGSNIGAGTITCNYDGFAKHRTRIGKGAFIGSNAALVAPVTVGDGAIVAAGSVITKDVEPDALAFARARQSVLPERAAMFREMNKGKKG